MPRYVALLRGVMPGKPPMPALRGCFEAAGFSAVRTLLASGNVVFDARAAPEAALAHRAEAALAEVLGQRFAAIVRPQAALAQMLERDPFGDFAPPAGAKRVVTFLREAIDPASALPSPHEGVHVLATSGREVFIAYLPHPRGPVFMAAIERRFGRELTTRTWDTVRKCAAA